MFHGEAHQWRWATFTIASLALLLALGLSTTGAWADAPAQASDSSLSAGKQLGAGATSTPDPTCDPDYTVAVSTGTIVPGTTDLGNHCDNCTTPLNIPFRYYLYNSWYLNPRVSSNGVL